MINLDTEKVTLKTYNPGLKKVHTYNLVLMRVVVSHSFAFSTQFTLQAYSSVKLACTLVRWRYFDEKHTGRNMYKDFL